MKRLLAYAAIYGFWGASFFAIRVVVAEVPPFFAAGVRFLLAGLVLLGFSLARRLPQPRGREWRSVAMLAVVLFVGDYAPLFWAERHLASGLAAVTAATIPAQVFLLEWLWLKRVRLTLVTAVGLLLGLAGVVALVLPAGFLHSGNPVNRYAAVALAAAFCWAFGTVLSTRLALPAARPVNAGWQMTLGGLALLTVSAMAGERGQVHPASYGIRVWLAWSYLIVFASLIAFSAYVYLLEHDPAQRVASYAYVNPVIALLLGVSFGGETVTARQGVACGVVILGVLVTLLGKAKAVQAKPLATR